MKAVPLGEIAEINPRLPASLKGYPNTLVSFLPMASVSENGHIKSVEERYVKDVIKGFRYFEQGDVLLAKITPCMENGKATLVDTLPRQIGFGSTEFHVLRPGKHLHGRYLFYMLWNHLFRFSAARNMTGTAGQKRVPADFLRRYKIPLPPLEEQNRIAEILDKADAIRKKRKQAIELTEQFLRSAFLDMFGLYIRKGKDCEWKPLKEAALFVDYRGKTPTKTKAGVKLITAKNVRKGYISEEPKEYISPDDFDAWMTRGFPTSGDVLFTTEAPLGHVAKLEHEGKVVIGQRLITLKPHDFLTSDYLLFCLQSQQIQHEIMRRSTGSTVRGIRSKEFEKITIPIPPLKDQKRFSNISSKATTTAHHAQAFADDSNNLFNALVQRAFRGQL